MTIEQVIKIRALFSANRTFGDIERECKVPFHVLAWLSWLRTYSDEEVADMITQVRVAVPNPPYGKGGLDFIRAQGWTMA